MEWAMLLVAAVLATAAVTTAHALRHPHAATTPMGLDRQVAENRAVHAVEADVEAAHEAAERLATEQHRRG